MKLLIIICLTVLVSACGSEVTESSKKKADESLELNSKITAFVIPEEALSLEELKEKNAQRKESWAETDK